jgi:glycosyltransferase involved in cell wall biosynthesis
MKVVIASTVVPFVYGGGTLIVDWLDEALRERGHEVEVLRLPFPMDSRGALKAMVGLRLLHLEDSCDRLVTIRYPSHVIRHPAKAAWFLHHQRGMFDLWGSWHQEMPSGRTADRYRELLAEADRVGLSEARGVFSPSRIVRDRLRTFNDIEAEVLYAPVWRPERFRNDGYGDYLFMPSRLTSTKRQYLAIEAMRHVTTPVRLVIAGPPDVDTYEGELRGLIGDDDRVELLAGWISEEEKVELLAGCLAVPYLPVMEDSYGYPSIEAHHAGKGVITVTDSGGVLELVVDGINGRVVKPDPVALAECFDELWEDRALAARLGAAGAGRMTELGIDWDHVVDSLLA